MDYIYIYSYKVAKDLLKSGFTIRDIKPNPAFQGRTAFMFEETKMIKDYLKSRHNIVI